MGSSPISRIFLKSWMCCSKNKMRKWRNWQTRRLQVPVVAIPCGFKSRLPHSFFICNYSEPSRFSVKSVSHARMNEHFWLKIYLARSHNYRLQHSALSSCLTYTSSPIASLIKAKKDSKHSIFILPEMFWIFCFVSIEACRTACFLYHDLKVFSPAHCLTQ